MVNFGKRLENGLKVPRWQSKYVNYKILKKYISEILGFEVSGDVSAAEARVDTFIKVLSEDIEVVEATYLNTIEELKESLGTLTEDVDALVNSAAFSGELEGAVEQGSEAEKIVKGFTSFSSTLKAINKFCLVNCEGIRKILKKYDKQVTVRNVDKFSGEFLKGRSFFRYTDMQSENMELRKVERTLHEKIIRRSPILEQFIKNEEGLKGMLETFNEKAAMDVGEQHVQCCEYAVRFTCCTLRAKPDKNVKFEGDWCQYYTHTCCKKCLGKALPSHLKRWLCVFSGVLLVLVGICIAVAAAARPSRLDTLVLFGMVLSVILGIGNGANDIANSVGTSVGAKALTLTQAIVLGALFEMMGALFMGTEVAKTISKGVIEPSSYSTNPAAGDCDGPRMFAVGMLAVLMGAGSTTLLATFYGLPISATHGIIGGLVAVGLTSKGPGSIGVPSLSSTMAAWVLSPVVGAVTAGVLHGVIQTIIYGQSVSMASLPNRSKRFQPVFLALGVSISMTFVLTKGPSLMKIKPLGLAIVVACSTGILVGLLLVLCRCVTRKPAVEQSSPKDDKPEDPKTALPKGELEQKSPAGQATDNLIVEVEDTDSRMRIINAKHREGAEKHFVPLLILSALTVAFAHGGNDVGNAIGPLAVIFELKESGKVDGTPSIPLGVLVAGAISFAVGICMLGPRTIVTVGSRITALFVHALR